MNAQLFSLYPFYEFRYFFLQNTVLNQSLVRKAGSKIFSVPDPGFTRSAGAARFSQANPHSKALSSKLPCESWVLLSPLLVNGRQHFGVVLERFKDPRGRASAGKGLARLT